MIYLFILLHRQGVQSYLKAHSPIWEIRPNYQRHLLTPWKSCLKENLLLLSQEEAVHEQVFQWWGQQTRQRKDHLVRRYPHSTAELMPGFVMHLILCVLPVYFTPQMSFRVKKNMVKNTNERRGRTWLLLSRLRPWFIIVYEVRELWLVLTPSSHSKPGSNCTLIYLLSNSDLNKLQFLEFLNDWEPGCVVKRKGKLLLMKKWRKGRVCNLKICTGSHKTI